MDDVGRWLFFIVFLLLSFFFSATETALVSANENKLREILESNKSKAHSVLRVFDGPIKKKILWANITHLLCLGASVTLGTLLLWKNLTTMGWYQTLLTQQEASTTLWTLVTSVFAFVVISLLVFAVGNVLPKKLAAERAEAFLIQLYPMVKTLSWIFRPLVTMIVTLANGLASICGVKKDNYADEITEEEIRSMVDAGEETGAIHQEEREMINNIFDFDDCMASELMTHRTDVVAVEINAKISDVVYCAINEGFSRIPVYENDIDNIKGVIYVKDLLCLVGCQSSEEFKIKDFIRETIYVPEAKKCIDLFRQFKLKKVHLAVVVDEYGGTAGIITMEDMLESIVGNIQDEYDDEQEEIIPLSDDSYLIDGSVDLEDVEELFGVKLEVDEDTNTLGGLLVETLGRIPDEGENPTVEIEGILFTIMLIEDRRVVRVKAEKLPEISEEETEEIIEES